MPELAEVLYFSRRWRPGLGERVTRVHLHGTKRIFRGIPPRQFGPALKNQPLRTIQTHGKQMLFRFGSDRWLGIHLGMTGKLFTATADHPPSKHDHLVLYTRNRALVFQDPRLFGRIRLSSSPRPPPWWSSLPIQVSDRNFTPEHLRKITQKRQGSPLKPLLLLQDFFPGIGNWMADEILWQAGLHPRTRAGTLLSADAALLHAKIRKVAREAIRVIGKDGSDPPRSWLFLHRWENGGRCPRCRTSLIRRPIGGRTTCWCPSCQKGELPRRRHRS